MMNPNEEKTLRESIRRIIRHVKNKRLNEENKLRTIIGKFADFELNNLNETATADVDPAPNKSTGINVLEQLLKKIVPVLEDDYKSLTTNSNQRESFRSHILNAVVNTLTPTKINNQAGNQDNDASDLEEEIEINVGDNTDDDKFIDIRTDAEKAAEDEVETDPRDDFGDGVEGDETGRNVAFQCFKKIETNIVDAYELLSAPEDQELFYDYIIANIKLYFDKFEEEIASNLEEPTNQAYNMAKSEQEPEEAGSDDLELEL